MILLMTMLAFVSPLQKELESDSTEMAFTFGTETVSVESVHYVDGDLVVVWVEEPALSTIPPQPIYKCRETYEIDNDRLELVKREVWVVERTHHVADGVSTTTVRKFWREVEIEPIPQRLEFETRLNSDSLKVWGTPSPNDYILLD